MIPRPSASLGILAFCLLGPGGTTLAQSTGRPPEQDRNQSQVFLESNIDRPLRYWPEGRNFVITNGTEYFNRPLYGPNIAFRVDGGDRPEFSFYLPGRGGNLRFGFRSTTETRWLDQRAQVIARYRPGGLSYEIRGATTNDGAIHLDVLPLRSGKGLIGRVEMGNYSLGAGEFILACGGVNGMRGRRGGDIGCEREPVGEFFQLHAEQCAGNQISTTGSVFMVRGKNATLAGLMSPASCEVADAKHWNDLSLLLRSQLNPPGPPVETETPIALMRRAMSPRQPFYFVVLQANTNLTLPDLDRTFGPEHLPGLFEASDRAHRAIAERVRVETPDPFVNAATAALNVAADAVWDADQKSFMHGAVAWRNRLLGWRGMYAGDALGWHERTRQHLEGFAAQQNTNPVPDVLPPADEDVNLSRSERALHSNGNLTRNHYDMNLVAVDAFFRHLMWTGDLDFARRMWPVLERHLAWERRLFRRAFGPDRLPLYEGYAAIWASDDLAYNGGGAAHSSAYNFYHNKMAARVARLLGKDPSPYEQEADLISRGMHRELWLPEPGWFAESKDLLGRQLVHPNAAAWTYYHTIDSEVPTPFEAWRMTGGLDTQFARIPLRGPGVPPANHTMPTSSWMPYSWSLNNVVMAEVMHTSLAYWQANRPDGAFPLFKGAMLDSMFLGLCPGNVGMCTYFDSYRRESQRDFADGVGATSRALVEGLFGLKPDALAGELTIRPGFPPDWDHASIRHPDLEYSFRRTGMKDTFVIEQKFATPMATRLLISRRSQGVQSVSVNGAVVKSAIADVPGEPRLEIGGGGARRQEIVVEWSGANVDRSGLAPEKRAMNEPQLAPMDWLAMIPSGKLETVELSSSFNDAVTQLFRNEYRSPRSPFCSLATPIQGIGSWCHPKDDFVVDDSGLRSAAARGAGRITLPNGVPFATPSEPDVKNILFVSQWDNYPRESNIPLNGKAKRVFLLMAGSTGPMQSRLDNGEVEIAYTEGLPSRLPLHNPTTWWPIDQDYYLDDFAFRLNGPLPPRVDLKTGKVRLLDSDHFKGRGGEVPGGAATVLALPLDPGRELKALNLRALANEVVIGLLSVTVERE